MEVSLEDLVEAGIFIQKGIKTREEVSNWASQLENCFDKNELVFIPSNKEEKIFNAISWLMGFDLKDFSGDYLYNEKDLINFINALKE